MRHLGLMLILMFAGCDGVGRALVATGHRGDGSDEFCAPMECRPAKFAPLMIPEPLTPNPECAPPSPEQCEPATETEPGLGRGTEGVCRRTLSLDDDMIDMDAIRSLSCGSARLVRSPGGAGALIRIENARWSQLDLTVEATDALTLELATPQLVQLRLRVSGSVTLRILDPTLAQNLIVESDSPSAKLDLVDAEVKAVRIGDESAEFAGTVELARSTIAQASLLTRDLTLETVALADARITAENLQWVDVTARRTKLAVGQAVISGSRLNDFEVTRCELLSIHGSSVTAYAIPVCSGGTTRLFESILNRGNLDGEIDADQTQINESVFGVSDVTDLQLWDTSMGRVNFCANTDHVVVAGKGTFSCATCRELDATQVPIDACLQADNQMLIQKCCRLLSVAPACAPMPIRMRPPFN